MFIVIKVKPDHRCWSSYRPTVWRYIFGHLGLRCVNCQLGVIVLRPQLRRCALLTLFVRAHHWLQTLDISPPPQGGGYPPPGGGGQVRSGQVSCDVSCVVLSSCVGLVMLCHDVVKNFLPKRKFLFRCRKVFCKLANPKIFLSWQKKFGWLYFNTTRMVINFSFEKIFRLRIWKRKMVKFSFAVIRKFQP